MDQNALLHCLVPLLASDEAVVVPVHRIEHDVGRAHCLARWCRDHIDNRWGGLECSGRNLALAWSCSSPTQGLSRRGRCSSPTQGLRRRGRDNPGRRGLAEPLRRQRRALEFFDISLLRSDDLDVFLDPSLHFLVGHPQRDELCLHLHLPLPRVVRRPLSAFRRRQVLVAGLLRHLQRRLELLDALPIDRRGLLELISLLPF
mmetsp:Transcript_23567/g.59508  ORF Transcript_23567/g.59508 Transcript_23567/m.59508 type:complete len:202 (+) Transcript_23567:732-1337(+)